MKSLIQLREALEHSWDKETAYSVENYENHDPAWGQCAVTACVVYNYFKCALIKGKVTMPDGSTTSHYWNNIDGVDVDLTWRQFPVGSVVSERKTADFYDLMENEWTNQRFRRLLGRVKNYFYDHKIE